MLRAERLTENQKLFRAANERLAERAEEYNRDGEPIPFLCECADDGCLGRVDLTPSQYQEVRAQRDRYVILRDHPTIERERVVEDNGQFQIVEKEA